MNMQNKVAWVTGGGTGIGRATSLELARRGAIVAISYSQSREDAESTVRMIAEEGGRAAAFKADVTRESEVRELAERIAARFGSIDLLVNNASVTRHIPMSDLDAATEEVWDELYAVNVKGMFTCAKAAAPLMKKSKNGAIVNVGSIAGLTGLGSSIPYAVSKAAVHGLTKSLAQALAPEIRVNCVAPGAVATRWWKGREETMNALIGKLPLQRIATPEDIAQIICSLLEQEAVTGQILTADAGQTL
ncbi:SDR family NAD(P)-dependent oxidoreductase [Paenibacillus chitinolyticus]|uniref:SDR family NAD(P)-dependent oxidoreductase n=1 Tax=Paenibacillus chitinolyticus TaxID=79263 RepID=UPI002DBF4FC9|nr:SDR family oxidoreductase [Paenibacillus chitinolyticus]MEC0248546.1 SDR family NAD(P)-dependent oxidoreductase [Paenibacillus chitinolyticus]